MKLEANCFWLLSFAVSREIESLLFSVFTVLQKICIFKQRRKTGDILTPGLNSPAVVFFLTKLKLNHRDIPLLFPKHLGYLFLLLSAAN